MLELLSNFTIPRLVYSMLTLNVIVLIFMAFKKDLVNMLIKHKKRVYALLMLTAVLLIIFVRGKKQ